MHSDEDPVTAALREAAEESTLPPDAVRVHGIVTEDHGNWAYHTVLATVPALVDVWPRSRETRESKWVRAKAIPTMRLFEPFANTWPRLKDGLRRPTLVVDCANVMGARADGWWKDRAGAAARLRDQLGALTSIKLNPFDQSFPELVLVVEGAAKGIGAGTTKIRVVDAPRNGDDTIVQLVTESEPDQRPIVVTADRELRGRSEDEGAEVLGPRWLLDQLSTG